MPLTATRLHDTSSGGGVASVQWEVRFTEDVTLTALTFPVRHTGTDITAYVNDMVTPVAGLTDGVAGTTGTMTLGTPLGLDGGVNHTIRYVFDTSRSFYFKDSANQLPNSGDGISYVDAWTNARWPYTSGVQPESVAAGVIFDLGLPGGGGGESLLFEGTSDLSVTLPDEVNTEGSWSWWTRPRAVAIDGKVYTGSVTQSGEIVVDEYDAIAGDFIARHVVNSSEPFDDHNNPSLILEPGQPPIVTWQRHSADNLLRYAIGTQPIEDGFTSGTPQTLNLGSAVTYSAAHVVGGVIYILTRLGSTTWQLISSSDWGGTWTSPKRVVSYSTQMYTASVLADDGRLRFAASAHPRESSGQSIYYAELDLATDTLYGLDGVTSIGTIGSSAVSLTGWDLAASPVSGYKTWVYDVSPGADPTILWGEMNTADNPSVTSYHFTTGAGGSWTSHSITDAGLPFGDEASSDWGGNYLGGAQFGLDGVIVSREDSGTWYVERWVTGDDGASWDVDLIRSSVVTRLARAWVVESRDGTYNGYVAVNAVVPPFSSYTNHDSQIVLYPAPFGVSPWTFRGTSSLSITLSDPAPVELGAHGDLALAYGASAYWPLWETSGSIMEDVSGNDRNGTIDPGVLLGQAGFVPSESGTSWRLNAQEGGEVEAEAWMTPSGGFSAEVWYYFDSITEAVLMARSMVGENNSRSRKAWSIQTTTSGGVNGRVYNDAGNTVVPSSAAGVISTGEPVQVMLVHDGTEAIYYVNGVEVAAAALSGSPVSLVNNSQPLTVGKQSPNSSLGSYAVDGRAQIAAFYGTPLTPSQVAALYDAGMSSGDFVTLTGSGESDASVEAESSGGGTPGTVIASASSHADFDLSTFSSAVTDNREGGRWRGASGVAYWRPALDLPAGVEILRTEIVAQAFTTPTIGPTGAATYQVAQVTALAHYDRVIVGNRDVTNFRDVPTPMPNFSLLEPLGYGPATMTFPQINAAFETPGEGDLTWLHPGASVYVERVDVETGEVVAADYKGVCVAFDHDGPALSVQIGGEASGRAALREKQVPIFFWTKDLGRMAHDAIRPLRLRFDPYLGPETGIRVMRFGGMGFLEYIQQVCSMAWTRTGAQWTILPDWNPDGPSTYSMTRKDRTTIHGTVYCDDTRQPASLHRDITEEPNRIFMTGVTPEGLRVRFGQYPGLKQTPVPPYPFDDERSFGAGTTDGDTDTGDGITILVDRLAITKYINREDRPGGYDADITRAVKDLQKDAGLNRTGNVNVKTWRALYDLETTGASLRQARIAPAAESDAVRPWNRSASGGKMSRNSDYDRSVLPVDRNVDAGTGFTIGQLKEWAEAELEGSGTANYVGSITFSMGALVAGEHNPGEPLTAADLMPARALRPGMNLWLPLFSGGILVHIAAVDVSDGLVKVDVDTRARDAMEVWEVIARNREARRSLRRAWLREHRSSTQTKDSTGVWDEVGGILFDRVPIEGGRWEVFPVIAGQEGTIQRLEMDTNPNAEYVVAVFGRKISPKKLRRMIGNPLTRAGSKRWERETVRDRLDAGHVLLYVAGNNAQPCGYWPKKKGGKDDNDSGSAPLTGRWVDKATFPYRAFPSPVIWVAVWADRDTNIPKGRIMRPQLEAGT